MNNMTKRYSGAIRMTIIGVSIGGLTLTGCDSSPTTATSPVMTGTSTSTTVSAPPASSGVERTPSEQRAKPPPPVPAGSLSLSSPLWPFTSAAEVRAWQQSYRSGGHSPWHLDADLTALGFTTGYLGFAEIDRVVSHSINGTDALVRVGYEIDGQHGLATAAVLHLARFGSGADAPWEVVGTKDTTLTLTQPHYGATVRSPMTVGGRITGVDENIRVQVRQLSTESPLGESAGVPAGGQSTPWSVRVPFHGATASALTVVAWTGGHIAEVEQFAITAVHV
jgi:hypothetical protein